MTIPGPKKKKSTYEMYSLQCFACPSNVIFLLILQEFHIMCPDLTHFPDFPCSPPPTLVTPAPPKFKNNNNKFKSYS